MFSIKEPCIMKTLVCVMVVITMCMAHPHFRDLIPNGYFVPNPCPAGGIWQAVGHLDPIKHTVTKNPFGVNFAATQHQWNVDLCRADSDGDGLSNGYELGDPNCIWQVGQPAPSTPKGHPGICEPIGVGHCHGHHGFQC